MGYNQKDMLNPPKGGKGHEILVKLNIEVDSFYNPLES